MEDPDLELSASAVATSKPDDAPAREPSREPGENPAQKPDEEQTGIIPGKLPGQPVDPADPRFPGSQPDLA
jgi:hypothetical protein